jgi:hypothetical protein
MDRSIPVDPRHSPGDERGELLRDDIDLEASSVSMSISSKSNGWRRPTASITSRARSQR